MWLDFSESIISLNPKVIDLGEVNIFEEAFTEVENLIKTQTSSFLIEKK